jgi:hypothetical protein
MLTLYFHICAYENLKNYLFGAQHGSPDLPVIPAGRRLWQEDHEFDSSLDYIARPCLQNKTNKRLHAQ